MIPIPLTTVVYDRGAAGAFTWSNPVSLAGRLSSYEDSIEARGWYKALRVSFRCSAAELKEWLDAGLLRGVRSYTPRGRLRWEGALVELKATIGPIVITRSLENMANVLLVSYGSDQGGTGNTATFSSAASIAEYGTKMLQADLSTTTAAGAANWAEVELVKAAWPQRSREISMDADSGGDIAVELRAVGRYELLDWLLTSNTSTTTTATNTQAVALLTAYNAVNNWFSTSAADIVATGHSDTEYIEPYSSYKEKLETLLSQGNSSKQALAWGIYDDGALTVRVWAGATPSTVAYYRDARDKTVRDPYGNVVEPWDVLPDAMAEDVAILGAAEDVAAIATETREYIARVGLRIGSGGVELTMEPDTLSTTSPTALAEAVQHPVGRGSTDRSSRASAVGRAIKKKTRTIHQSTDNPRTPTLTGGGSIDTGGGSIDLDPGGGTITLPGGGGTITLPPPGGGGSTLLSGSGTAGQLAKWTGTTALGNATAGTDYVAPSALGEAIDDRVGSLLVAGNLITLTYNDASNSLTIAVSSLNETIDDRVAALLVAGTGISLSYNDAGNALTISSTGGTVGGTGTAGRLMQWASGGADAENSTLVKTGSGVLTLATSTTTLTLTLSGGSGQLDFTSPSSNDALLYDGSKFTPTPITSSTISNFNEAVDDRVAALLAAGTGIGLSYNDTSNTLTISSTVTGTVGGTGTAGRLMQWASGGANAENSTLAKTGAGVLTLSAASTYTATVSATGTVVMGTGAADRIAYWGSTNGITSNANLEFDGLDLHTNSVRLLDKVYIASTQVVGARRTGWAAASGVATRSTFATSTVTTAQLAERVKALIDDLITHGLIGT